MRRNEHDPALKMKEDFSSALLAYAMGGTLSPLYWSEDYPDVMVFDIPGFTVVVYREGASLPPSTDEVRS